MKQITRFNNSNYTIGANGQTVVVRHNKPGKVIYLTVEQTERLIAELDASLNQLAQEAKQNG